ncbi:MAG: serine/threonine-protein kinase [Planctomycetota bacterium]
MSTTDSAICLQCGKSIPSALGGRNCPQCLMKLAIAPAEKSTSAGGFTDSVHVPPIEQLSSAFPNLEILHLIGHGGMGAVYQARQTNLDRLVAVKFLSPKLGEDPAFSERFLREARTLAKLSHPNIVTVFDFGQANEFHYLTMEWIDGVNLRDTIAAGLIHPSEALSIVPQICDALQYAHDHGVVHRDIKPENILVSKTGHIKIADFGLAKILDPSPDQYTLTATRQIMGTRNYMAPEQIESPEDVDHRADLYSLGVVFYELLTGELPLGRFSLPSEKSQRVSDGLDRIVMRTLEKDRGQRFQQASEIKTACHSVVSEPVYTSARNSSPEPTMNHNSDARPIAQTIPITLSDLYANLAEGIGLLKAYESHLEVEYEIRDSVVHHKWSSAKATIPLDRLVSITLYQGLIYTYIELQADNFETVGDIPSSQQGKLRLYTKKRHRPEASALVDQIQLIIGEHRGTAPAPPIKKRGQYAASPRPHQDTQSFLKTILTAIFIIACCGFLLIMTLAPIWYLSYESQSDVPRIEMTEADSEPVEELGEARSVEVPDPPASKQPTVPDTADSHQ